MEPNKTTQFQRTVNAGMRSIFNGNGSRFYIIEHKDDSTLHRRGEQQKIIVDEVFLGRDKLCQVQIDERFSTVSRKHASIIREGERLKIVHQSQTNDTYVNGQRVLNEQPLQNGDEIQLSANGPRFGIIIPEGEQSLVKSIGMTARLNLFRQQALRPYKTAITLICIVFGLLLAGLATWSILDHNTMKSNIDDMTSKNSNLQNQIDSLKNIKPKPFFPGPKPGGNNRSSDVRPSGELAAFENDVYFVRMTKWTVNAPEILDEPWDYYFNEAAPAATGFITSDGYFVTARHVIEPWAYFYDTKDLYNPFTMAAVLVELGGHIEATIVAESKNGDRRTFRFHDFTVSKSREKEIEITTTDSDPYQIRAAFSNNDYAYLKLNKTSNIVVNRELSNNIPAGTKLDILGFPYGFGGDKNNIQPQYAYATTASAGLYHGLISVTGVSFDTGNSGGPVFCKKDGKYYLVGIVSSAIGRHGGVIVPISTVKY